MRYIKVTEYVGFDLDRVAMWEFEPGNPNPPQGKFGGPTVDTLRLYIDGAPPESPGVASMRVAGQEARNVLAFLNKRAEYTNLAQKYLRDGWPE